MYSKLNYFGFIILLLLFVNNTFSQKVVGLDNWFNAEIHKKTGLPYHYLWTDTAWSGYSRWGSIFTSQGAQIVHISKPNSDALKDISVYIIVDPDSTSENPSPNYITETEAQVVEDWVKQGGTLVLLANDGPNCEFTHLNTLSSRFGIIFNHVSLRPVLNKDWEMGAFTILPEHPIFNGIHKVYLKEISSVSLTKPALPILVDNGNIIMAESKLEKGRVIAIGDPWIYNEYIDHDRLPVGFGNRKAAENFTKYLLSGSN